MVFCASNVLIGYSFCVFGYIDKYHFSNYEKNQLFHSLKRFLPRDCIYFVAVKHGALFYS